MSLNMPVTSYRCLPPRVLRDDEYQSVIRAFQDIRDNQLKSLITEHLHGLGGSFDTWLFRSHSTSFVDGTG